MTRFALIFPVLLIGCTEAAEMPSRNDGEALFFENCAVCHGVNAMGESEVAALMSPRPADLTSISARNGGSFPRAQVLSMIDGYNRNPVEGVEMPEFGLLLEGELIPLDTGDGILTPTPAPLVALMLYLESIQD